MKNSKEDPSLKSSSFYCLRDLLTFQAGRVPDAAAIVAPERAPLTYAGLRHHVERTVTRLHDLGVSCNDRVAIVLPNGPEMASAFLAVAAGATAAPLNPAYRQSEFDFYLGDLEAKAVIVQAGDESPVRDVARQRGIPLIELVPISDGEEAGLFDLRCAQVPRQRIALGPSAGFAQPEDTALVLHTSGTTSRPKIVPLTQTNICASARNIGLTLQLSPQDRCLNVMPLFHIHGLMAALLASLAAGASVVCTPGFFAPRFFDWMREFSPSWYTAVPTMHQAILARSGANRETIDKCSLRLIRSSSAALPTTVLAELEKVFGVPVVESYGMTEAAHQMASNPLPPGLRKLGSAGMAAGPEIAIVDEAGQFLTPDQSGEIVIRGDNVTQGYDHVPQANASAFTNDWLRTGDQGYLDNEGYLFITGRIKEIINRGGEKISPREVDEVLLAHPAVAQAVAFATSHAQLGEDVVAAVVLKPDVTSTERELQKFAAARLVDFKVPRRILLMDEIPKGPTGKVQRIGLAEKLGLTAANREQPKAKAEFIPPRTPVEEALVEIWAQVLDVERVGIHDNFFDLGGDSMLAMQVISRVQAGMQVELAPLHFFGAPTVAGMAATVTHRIEQAEHEELARILANLEELSEEKAEWLLAHTTQDQGELKESPSSLSSATKPKKDLDERIVRLSPAKQALLELKLRQKGSGASRERVIPPRTERGSAPLSFAQERSWFLEQLEPGNLVHNRPIAVRLTGPLDVAALKRSLNEIVRRHEALRTTFPTEGGRPVQLVAPPRPFDITVADLSDLSESEREAQVGRLAKDEARRPFNLTRGPLLRAGLLRLGAEEHVLLLTMHHIVSDGWSDGVLFRELAALYEAFSSGRPSPLPELPIQYADFAAWQREWLGGEVLETQLSYWRQQLEDIPAGLELPTDRPRPPVQTTNGATRTFSLSETLSAQLKELSRREGATLFMTLLAGFQALLSCYTGQDDVLVGVPVAGRDRLETEGLIGTFINTLVLRGDLSGDPDFRELLGRVRKAAWEAYTHQDLPFQKLVEELKPERDMSRHPLFQVMFQLRNLPNEPMELTGLTLEDLKFDSGIAKVDLTLNIVEKAEGLSCAFEYNTDLFDSSTIDRMLGHFQSLLERIVANPDQRLSELPLLTEAERHRMVVEWNDTAKDYPRDRCIHELFEEQVGRTPDAVAVVFEDEQLTYCELNRRANQLAHYLRRVGVGPEVRVGICVERSLEMVVGLLGILKAGGAYVPLDPTYPKERLSFMLEDAQVPVLLTQEWLADHLPEHEVRTVCLDAEWKAITREREENPLGRVTADGLAYVMYTSGSTGRPKGVMVCHRGVCNYLHWRQMYFPLTEADRLLQTASLSFDDSVWEFFEPLMVGARVVMVRPGGQHDSGYLIRLIAEQRITAACFVPSLLQVLLEEPSLESCDCLCRVTTGGETLSVELQERFFARIRAGLHNGYGPTEATISATFWTCERGGHRRTVPIGRPIANTQIYLLDQNLQPVPVGLPGELHIGGDGLTRGYLNHPELTAEKFIVNPFGDEPGARLYKTGDLARYLPDGNIEFLGRLDHQIKLRGFRIELGEVESVLNTHAAVRDSVVVLREDVPTQKRLIAYVAPMGAAPSPGELRAFMKTRVPKHMVPSAFVMLEALPLTPNGKVDRHALPAPEGARPDQEAAFVGPRTPTEVALTGIWAAALQLPKVGVDDDFFELGGHSLLATQVISRLRGTFQMELPSVSLFEAPTVAQLARVIDDAREMSPSAAEVIIGFDEVEERL